MAAVKAASEAICIMSLFREFGQEVQARIHLDASAALAIIQRQGIGKVRHLDVGVLWLQEQQFKFSVEILTIKGTSNPADLMTKHLSGNVISKYMLLFSQYFYSGRAGTAARLYSLRGGAAEHDPFWKCLAPGTWTHEVRGQDVFMCLPTSRYHGSTFDEL